MIAPSLVYIPLLESKPPQRKDGVLFKQPSESTNFLENTEGMKESASAKISGSGKGHNIGWYSAKGRKGRFPWNETIVIIQGSESIEN